MADDKQPTTLRLVYEGENPRNLADNNVEVWAPVPYSPNRYWVSNLGRIASKNELNKDYYIRTQRSYPGQYATVGLYINKGDRKSVTYTVHRLCVIAFDGDPPTPEHTDIRHLDGNKNNNNLNNLAYGTRSDNMLDLWEHKGETKNYSVVHRIPNRSLTLSETLVQTAIKEFERGILPSVKSVAEYLDCSNSVADRILRGKTWPHLIRDQEKINARIGRTGGKHHLSSLNDEKLIEGLQYYVDNRLSSEKFAEKMGISIPTAKQILSGKTWNHIERPAGFEYPWPENKNKKPPVIAGGNHHRSILSEESVIEGLKKWYRGEFGASVKDLASFWGVKDKLARALIKGTTWGHIDRKTLKDEALQSRAN